MIRHVFVALSALAIVTTHLRGAEVRPAGGAPVAPADPAAWKTFPGGGAGVAFTSVDVAGQPFARARRVDVRDQPASPYAVQVQAKTTARVEKGDALLMTFWMRGAASRAESGEAYVNAVFEQAGPPHAKSLNFRCGAAKEWKQFQLPFAAGAAYGPGEAQVAFHCGLGVQTIEIGGVEVVNYGKAVKVSDLPRTKVSYPGREADAAWRTEALARIERIRKADLTVRVTDAGGQPVAGAKVEVKMTRHAFGFGSAVVAQAILGSGPDDEAYRAHVRRLFNRVVMENDHKWPQWEGNRERAERAVEWLRGNGIEVRGHNLVWPGWRYLPRDVRGLAGEPENLRRRVADHVTETAAAMRGKVVEWDVINEPFTNKDLQAILGDSAMVDWFKLARAADPGAVLFLNDYPMLSPRSEPHVDHFEKTIRFLIDNGAPIGGIGIQGHYGSHLPPPTQLVAGLDRFAKFNLPIAVTELDIDTTDEELQADYLRDHLIACFAHPAVNSVIQWGFWEGRHWKPNAALYRKDWTPKPAAKVFETLLFETWWTDRTLTTDASGVAAIRGFQGDYEIRYGGRTTRVTLPRAGATVTLRP